MIGLSKVAVNLVLLALIFGSRVDGTRPNKRDAPFGLSESDFAAWMCSHIPSSWPSPSYCQNLANPTTPVPSAAITTTGVFDFLDESASSSSSYTLDTTVNNNAVSTTLSPSELERGHWCRFTNGSYLPPGYTFMNAPCTICQCTQSREIRCAALQCMPTHCIDDSNPVIRAGQCCGQCAYESHTMSCVYNGFTFPHGTIIKTTGDTLKCWCQYGSIECRGSSASMFADLDVWGQGTAVYVVVIILIILLIIGTILCCTCTGIYYYYYQHAQRTSQEAHDQYWNTAGWQPMDEDGTVADPTAEEKQAEAEQNQYQYDYPAGFSETYVLPPYAIYTTSQANDNSAKEQ